MKRSLFQTNITLLIRRVPRSGLSPDELEESTMMSPPVVDVQEPEPALAGLGGLLDLRPSYLTYIAHGVGPDETEWSKHGLCYTLCNTWHGAGGDLLSNP